MGCVKHTREMDYTTRDTLDIRAFAEDDAEDFQRLRLRALKEYPDAFGLSSETVADKLRLAAESQDDFTLGAYRDGELVGMAGFYRDSGGEKMRHKGHVWGMYVASKRQGEGIGRALMRELLARASLLPGLVQVHLAVVTRQEPARSLYASLGFETYGVEPNSLIIDGERLDEAHMVYSVAKRTKEVFHMSYTADISRNNPGCFLFLIDQSGSMGEALGGQPELRKMDGAADAVNRILDAISQRCSQGMDIRDYFDIGVIAYGTDGAGRTKLETALPGTTPEEPFLSVSQVVDAAEVEGGQRVRRRRWDSGSHQEVSGLAPPHGRLWNANVRRTVRRVQGPQRLDGPTRGLLPPNGDQRHRWGRNRWEPGVPGPGDHGSGDQRRQRADLQRAPL